LCNIFNLSSGFLILNRQLVNCGID
jgi:hypothetical protein